MNNKINNWLFTFLCVLLLFSFYNWCNFCFWYVSWISLACPVILLHKCISHLKHISIWEELSNLHCRFWEHIHDIMTLKNVFYFNWEKTGYVSFAYTFKQSNSDQEDRDFEVLISHAYHRKDCRSLHNLCDLKLFYFFFFCDLWKWHSDNENNI